MLTADLDPVIELNEDMIKSVPVTMLNAVLDPVKLIEDVDMMKASPVQMRTVAVDPVKLKLDEDMIKSSPAEMLKFIMFGPLMELDDDMAKFSQFSRKKVLHRNQSGFIFILLRRLQIDGKFAVILQKNVLAKKSQLPNK